MKQEKYGESMIFFRGHHVLGDGASLGSSLVDLFDEGIQIQEQISNALSLYKSKQKKKIQSLWQKYIRYLQKMLQFLLGTIYSLWYQFYLHFMSSIYDVNPWKQIEQYSITNDHILSIDRTLSYTNVATVEQMKWVANELGGSKCTINDVFVSCLSAAIVKQLQYHRDRLGVINEIKESSSTKTIAVLPHQSHMHIAMPVHLKGGIVLPGESLGNNLGAIVVRVPSEMNTNKTDNNQDVNISQTRLQIVHEELYKLKNTPTALLSHIGAKILSYTANYILPISWASKLYSSSNANSIAVISNNRASNQAVHMNGREVTNFYGFVPLPPGIPIGIVVMSYNGTINCTITAQKWAVPDANQFLVWILEEYINLVQIAKEKQAKQSK